MQYHDQYLKDYAHSRLARYESQANRQRLLHAAGFSFRSRLAATLISVARRLESETSLHGKEIQPADSLRWPVARF